MRRTGRTLAMVKGLPAGGSIVVVHNGPMVDYVRRMIMDVRGPTVALWTTVRHIATREDARRTLVGVSVPIVVDHAFWQHASREAFAAVDQAVSLRPAKNAYPFDGAPSEPTDTVPIEGDLKRLDVEEGDILVFRTRSKLTAEQAERIAGRVDAFAARHGFREVRTMVLDGCSDLDVADRPRARQETRRTPFGCPTDPRRVDPFDVTSASISEAYGTRPTGRAPLRTAEG